MEAFFVSLAAVAVPSDHHMPSEALTVLEHVLVQVAGTEVGTEAVSGIFQPSNFSYFAAPKTSEIYLCYWLVMLSII